MTTADVPHEEHYDEHGSAGDRLAASDTILIWRRPATEIKTTSGGSRTRTYSAAEFQTLARKRVEEALGARAIPGTEMNAILGPFSDGKAYSSVIYEIKLLDLDPAETSYVELVIPRKNSSGGSPGAKSLEEQARFLENRPVKVRGDVQTNTFNGRISFRLWVRQITDLDNEELQTHDGRRERERSLLSVLSEYGRFGQDAPHRSNPQGPFKVCVIHPASGQVHDDFMGRISSLGSNLLETQRVPVSFHDPVASGQAISRTNADIIALIRGGGDATEFRTLNDPELIRQWMNVEGYTVSGLGHAQDATLSGKRQGSYSPSSGQLPSPRNGRYGPGCGPSSSSSSPSYSPWVLFITCLPASFPRRWRPCFSSLAALLTTVFAGIRKSLRLL